MGRRKEAEKFEIDHFLMESLRKEYRDLERILEELREYASSSAADSIGYEKLIEAEKKIKSIQDQILEIINNSKPSLRRPEVSAAGPPVIIRCKNWNDFKSNAREAKAVSYLLRAEENVFQADALKNGMIYTYSGQIPDFNTLLRVWLSRQLNVDEEKIFEGVLAIG